MSRKRIRLSSPTFDDQVGDLSQDDINVFDSLDAQLSQPSIHHQEEENPFRAIDHPHSDYTAWFNPVESIGGTAVKIPMPAFQRPSIAGQNAKTFFIPSDVALREAKDKMRKWQEDLDQDPLHKEPGSTQVTSPPPAIFASARNAFSSVQPPETPTPAPLLRSANPESSSHSSLLSTRQQIKPFKSPFIGVPSLRQPSTSMVSSPLRDHQSASQSTLALSPLRPSSVANHAASQKPLGFTPMHGTTTRRPKFVTPFKASGISRASAIENIKLPSTPSAHKTLVNRIYPPSLPFLPPIKQNNDNRIFDLTPPSGRRSLATSGLWPQTYSAKQLEDMGIDFKKLGQVNLQTAPFYAFTTRLCSSTTSDDPSSSIVLDRSVALEELHERGCTLAKQVWVDNHWSLVLWKLAGMVALDPISENDPSKKRWCWPEVIRQLMYRYERDLNSSSRPPLRLITTRDASAESPMVLCISDIIWPASGSKDDTTPVQPCPELEVTDGWYRLRARIDAPIARAVRKGKIKVGRKIALAGAKLSAERKDGSEILEAYNSNVLLLTGNSTHMAPWHMKLGFQRAPFIATLNSLTPDGGNIAVMVLTVVKAYPLGYIEFIEDADGRKQREGPHDAKEELKLSTQWKRRRESHASKLWSEYEKRRYRLLDHAEHLEQRAGSKFRPIHEDGPPDKIYDMYDTLQEDPEGAKSIISTINHEDAGWLARYIRERAIQERDGVSKEIEQELESVCPPRDVKGFCVVVVNDARTYKRPSKRTAQVTVWDVPGVSATEGCTQTPFVPGQRYLVTNLVPTQASAWMDCSGGEVYLSTRKSSKWTLVQQSGVLVPWSSD